jgi:Flp pilus assembly protein TadD/mono/diheme cytochrome c family protein
MTRLGLALVAATLALGAAAPATAQPAPVTFNQHLAPVLHRACAQCHRPNGAGPFSLVTFADAARRAKQLAAVTRSGFMPPWKADGHVDEFVAQPRLTPDEIALFARWADDPVEGPGAAPAPPVWPAGWYLGTPDLIVTLPAGYTLPAEPSDVFRIFSVPLKVDGTKYVRGIEFHPGNDRVVHHANIRIDKTGGSRRLDDADPLPGYDGLLARSAEYPDGHFLGWTPGQIAPLVGPDLAWRLDPGTDLVVQLHMQPSGKPEAVRPEIGLYFSDRPATRTPSILRLGSQGIDIPPGDGAYVVQDRYTLPVDATLLAVQPHAHYRAKDVTGTARFPDGTTRTLIHIGGWDFRWQHVYRYTTPIALPKGTTVSMRYVYDNSPDNPRNPQLPPARVRWGQRSFDEMGDLWFQLATGSDDDRAALTAEVQAKMTAEDLIGLETMLLSAPDDVELHDDAGVLALQLGRPSEAVSHFRASAARRPDDAAVHYNLGTALTQAGQFADAVASYERALTIRPRYARALSNLGDTLVVLGRADEAIRRYEAAIAADPQMPEARNNLGAALWRQGDLLRAERELREALRLRPGYAEAYFNLGHAAVRARRIGDAAGHFRQAAALKPDWVIAQTTAAWVLATAGDGAVRAPAEAVALAERAAALTGRRDARALDVLAVAYASAGRFDDAVAAAREALPQADAALAAEVTKRLALFERREAFVDRR